MNQIEKCENDYLNKMCRALFNSPSTDSKFFEDENFEESKDGGDTEVKMEDKKPLEDNDMPTQIGSRGN